MMTFEEMTERGRALVEQLDVLYGEVAELESEMRAVGDELPNGYGLDKYEVLHALFLLGKDVLRSLSDLLLYFGTEDEIETDSWPAGVAANSAHWNSIT